MRDIRMVMFDLDGCLCDTAAGIIESVKATLSHLGQRMLPDGEIRAQIGRGARYLITQCVEDASSVEEALAFFKPHYAQNCVDNTLLYPGVMETLGVMQERGIVMGVQTNKFGAATRGILQKTGIAPYFAMVLGEEDVTNRKPHPEGIQKMLAAFGIAPQNAAYVGDMQGDIETGRNALVHCVAVSYGLGDISTLGEADVCLERFDSLLTWLFGDAP